MDNKQSNQPTVIEDRPKPTGPQGVGFFNIKSGETHYARMEPQIQAFINSSDLGINASRGQDFGWRLEPAWVQKIKTFLRDENKMVRLTDKNGGRRPTTPQILYAIYGEQVRAAQQHAVDNENPYEEEYLKSISGKALEPEIGQGDALESDQGLTPTVPPVVSPETTPEKPAKKK